MFFLGECRHGRPPVGWRWGAKRASANEAAPHEYLRVLLFLEDGGYGVNPLIRSLQGMNPRFSPPKTRKALIFELEVGRDYLKKQKRCRCNCVLPSTA